MEEIKSVEARATAGGSRVGGWKTPARPPERLAASRRAMPEWRAEAPLEKDVDLLRGVRGLDAEAQFRLAEQALAQIRESVVVTSTELDEPGPAIVYVNAAFTRMTGYLPEEVIGKNPRFLQGPKTTRKTLDRLRAQLQKGEAFEGEDINYRKDGSEFYIDWYIEPLRGADGRINYWVAVQRDVTERRALELQLLQAQRLEALGLLASGIAHDLNNVLAPVLMGSDFLRGKVSADGEQFLPLLEEAATRGAGLIKQILSFARGIAGDSGFVEPARIVDDIVRMAAATFPKTIRVVANTAPDLWSIEADPTQLHQVLLNFCVNARDAIGESGTIVIEARNVAFPSPRATVRSEMRAGRYVLLSVSDTGSGMSMETVKRIFDPFFSTKTPEHGTGLGLATVALIVKNHGGAIDVQTAPGEGTTFSVYFPAATAPAPVVKALVRNIPRNGGGRRVLIADDEAAVLEIMRETLASAGYDVSTARDGIEAIAAVSEFAPEVVLIDLNMPNMNGGSALRELRARHPQLPVIAISGLSRSEIEAAAPEASTVLEKPFGLAALLTAVGDVLAPRD